MSPMFRFTRPSRPEPPLTLRPRFWLGATPLVALMMGFGANVWAVQAPQSLSPPQLAQAKPNAPANKNAPPAAVVDSGLSDQVLYQYLISEIAVQRGRAPLAARGILDLAKKTGDTRLTRRAAEVAFQARDPDTALDAAILWLAAEPDSGVARQLLATLALSQDTLASAKESLVPLLRQSDKTAVLLEQLPALLSRFQDRAAVYALVRELAAPYLPLAESHYALAHAAMRADDVPAATQAIDTALTRRPQWQQAALFKAQILRESSEEKAIEFVTAYLARHREAADVRKFYARLLVGQRAFLSAREEFRQVASQRKDDPEAPYSIGLLSLQIEDFEDAHGQLQRALTLKPRDPNAVRFNLGVASEGRKRAEDALDWYRQVGAGEYFVAAKLKSASVISKRDGLDAARRFLQQSQQAEEEQPDVRTQLILAEAQLLRDAKALGAAYELLTAAHRADTASTDILYDRAMVAEKLARFEDMEADLRRVIQAKPESPHAFNALGYSFAERNIRLPEALTLIQRAVELAPEDAFIQDSLGWVLFRQGKMDAALATLRSAYKTRRDPEIAAHLGEVLWLTGAKEEAALLLKGAALEHPHNDVLGSAIRRFAP